MTFLTYKIIHPLYLEKKKNHTIKHIRANVVSVFQNANIEFCNAKASNQTAAQREALLKDLAAGFDSFVELKGNLEEGTKVRLVWKCCS